MTRHGGALFFWAITLPYSTLQYTQRLGALALAVLAVGAPTLASGAQEDLAAQRAGAAERAGASRQDLAAREDLVVVADGFANDRGQAFASLFREGDDVFGKPRVRITAKVVDGKAVLVFPRLEHGRYAVIVFHDENGNGDLDHNFLRFPSEPLGFSNGFRMTLFSGLPTFEKLRFVFAGGAEPVAISVR